MYELFLKGFGIKGKVWGEKYRENSLGIARNV